LRAQLTIGEWRSHLPYINAKRVIEAGDRIYCSTRTGLFYLDKTDQSIHLITRIDGLSDLEINAIEYSGQDDILVIAYGNANLDLVKDGMIINIPDINRKQITGNKSINDILIVDHLAYLSCGFGIVVVNLDREEIKDTYYIGENGGQVDVKSMAFDGQYLYAATVAGLYRADVESPNLIDYNYWEKVPDIPNHEGSFTSIVYFDERIFVSCSDEVKHFDTIYYYKDSMWEYLETQRYNPVRRLNVSQDKLLVSSLYYIDIYNKNGSRSRHINTLNPQDALIDRDNIMWVADETEGLTKNAQADEKERIIPNGPISTEVVKMAISGNYLYSVAGGVDLAWNNVFNKAELNIFKESFWEEGFDTSAHRDLVSLAIDPGNSGHVFAGSWGYGLLEFREGELVEVYRDHNSSLQTVLPGDFFRLGGLCYDDRNNLWVVNANVSEAVSVMKPDGSWKSFSFGGQLKDPPAISDIICTSLNHFWMILPKNYGMFAFTVNGTLDDESDDEYERIDIVDANGEDISNNVFSLVEDLDGNIWMGTDKGVVVYYSPGRVFRDETFYGQQVIVPRNDGTGLADILLGTETVTALAVDGANRKWVGTSKSGVFLLSEDGLEEIYNFTKENSPLFSNSIQDIAIHPSSGEVYFGTDKGIISFQSSATAGNELFKDVYVYPNPVREDYEGEIIITGMIREARIKITDINGNLVYETTSLGGQAIWDGRSFSGARVKTGVYLIFCTNDDGSETHITKLLIIN